MACPSYYSALRHQLVHRETPKQTTDISPMTVWPSFQRPLPSFPAPIEPLYEGHSVGLGLLSLGSPSALSTHILHQLFQNKVLAPEFTAHQKSSGTDLCVQTPLSPAREGALHLLALSGEQGTTTTCAITLSATSSTVGALLED